MAYNYDLIVIGGGPAGYAAAIRGGQLKKRVLCVEKADLGGTCLNWGCIPTKALLESAGFVRKLRENPPQSGIQFDNLQVDFKQIVSRSRDIATKLSKGIAHLLSKYQVKHEKATATLLGEHKVRVASPAGSSDVTADQIIIATGAKARGLPGIEPDGRQIITSREALVLEKIPERLAIIGAGAIGCEFADIYSSLGSKVTIIEMMDQILPIEDAETATILERSFSKRGITVLTRSKTEKIEMSPQEVLLTVSSPKGNSTVEADLVLLAVGVSGNLDGLIAPGVNLATEKGHIQVDDHYRTSLENVWAVGDVAGPPWLAHVAHHEAIYCVEKVCGLNPHPVDYNGVPGCTYTHPQIASVGLTEKACRQQNRNIRIGKFPFAASGRALAAGSTEGFVKLIFNADTGELLGAHLVGDHVTELLSELLLARSLESTEAQIIQTMHPHPTLSEAIMEAAGAAYGRAVHL